MRIVQNAAIAAIAAALAGCASTITSTPSQRVTPTAKQIAAAKEFASHDLKDPSSAQFRNIYGFRYAGQDMTVICGEMNGKNSYGAYEGFNYFAVKFNIADEIIFSKIDDAGGLEVTKNICTRS